MYTLRMSYSTLYALKRGDQDQAWANYWKLDFEPNQAMIDGRKAHKKWEREVLAGGQLPTEFATPHIGAVKSERKFEKEFMLADDIKIVLVGVIDAYGGQDTADFKLSKNPAGNWITTEQGCVYQLLRPEARRFWILAKNPTTGEITRAMRWLSSNTAKTGLQFVYTWTLEMIRIFGVEALNKENQ